MLEVGDDGLGAGVVSRSILTPGYVLEVGDGADR
jgi:hypothetical protein